MPRNSDDEEEEIEKEDKGTLLSWDVFLPDELLQKVLSLLPIANIIKLGIVCKRWYKVVHSSPPLSWSIMEPQKPLFFMFCFDDYLRLEKSIWRTSSSCGLVCLMNANDGDGLFVGNPIKRDWKLLPRVPGDSSPQFNALAFSFDRRTRDYTVVVTKCTELPGTPWKWHLSVHIYESTTKSWVTLLAQDIEFWMGSNEAVICNGVLYYVIGPVQRPYLLAFDLAKLPFAIESLIQEAIPVPFNLACAGLINLSNKLVMVGRMDGPRKGVVILELEDKTWQEVAHTSIPTYMTFDSKDFISCGVSDFLFMYSRGWPVLLTFDMRQKVWKWSFQLSLCPRLCTEPLQFKSLYYCDFYFEPRLDVSS